MSLLESFHERNYGEVLVDFSQFTINDTHSFIPSFLPLFLSDYTRSYHRRFAPHASSRLALVPFDR